MCRTRLTLTCRLVGFVLLGLSSTPALSQEWWWPPSMTIEPLWPNTDDPVTITLAGEWPDSCIPNGSAIHLEAGRSIRFDVIWDYPPQTACLTVITPWARSETLSPLCAGTYEVHATLYDRYTGTPLAGPTYVGSFTVVPAWRPGDLNCDGTVDFDDINPFVLALLGQEAYERRYADCRWLNGDTQGDGAVDFDDISPFVALLADPGPRVAGYGNSGCLSERGDGGCAEPDEVALTVEGHTLHVVHRNATYNCCVDDIVIRLSVQGSLLLLTEEEVLTTPCFCICCYDVEATIAGLASGTYTVQFCWYDYETQGTQCVTQMIVIP